MNGPAWTYEALPKAALYMAVLTAVGVALTHWLLICLAPRSVSAEALSRLDRKLASFGILASILALLALAGRVFAHTAVVFGAMEALHWDNLHVIAIESRWGHAWTLQFFTVIALMASAIGIRLHRRAGWTAFTAAALVLCVMIPRLGHGATSSGSLILHSLHLFGVSVWLGTLAVIVALCFRRHAGDAGAKAGAVLISNFSTIALMSAALVTITGVIAAAIYIGTPSNLYLTAYGRTLLVKIAGFFCILACGWSNWRRVRDSQPPQMRVLIAELAFAAAVVIVTSVLTEMEHP